MKKNNKWGTRLTALMTCVLLAGCSLAKPEVQVPKEDEFVGFHLVYEKMPPSLEEYEANQEAYPPEDRTHWVEYGSEDVELEGLGKVAIPREILIGQFDENAEWPRQDYLFPGLDGYNCFLAEEKLADGGTRYAGFSGLNGVNIAEGGAEESLSGTIYMGLPLGQTEWDNSEDAPEYMWTAYRVYQMADGTVYLDGSGNSYSGVGLTSGMRFSEKVEQTDTVDGEETERRSFEVKVEIKGVPRLESVVVTQFGTENAVLTETAFAQEELADGETLTLERDALWLLVEERAIDGSVKRTVYDRSEIKEDGLNHGLILLDDLGRGMPAWLTIRWG